MNEILEHIPISNNFQLMCQMGKTLKLMTW